MTALQPQLTPLRKAHVRRSWQRTVLSFLVAFGPGLIVMEADNDAFAFAFLSVIPSAARNLLLTRRAPVLHPAPEPMHSHRFGIFLNPMMDVQPRLHSLHLAGNSKQKSSATSERVSACSVRARVARKIPCTRKTVSLRFSSPYASSHSAPAPPSPRPPPTPTSSPPGRTASAPRSPGNPRTPSPSSRPPRRWFSSTASTTSTSTPPPAPPPTSTPTARASTSSPGPTLKSTSTFPPTSSTTTPRSKTAPATSPS